MPVALNLIDAATLAALHIAAEGAALVFALAIAGAVYLMSAVSYRG